MARAKRPPGPPFQRRGARPVGMRPFAKVKLPPGTMNRSEERYAEESLEPRRRAGEILTWQYQPVRLRLARESIFTPDFGLLRSDGVYTLQDFKGFQEIAALVRIKVAASLYWWWAFELVSKRTKKAGGGYEVKPVEPWNLDGPTQLAATMASYDVSEQGVLKWGD